MSNAPPEDLIVTARYHDPRFIQVIASPDWDAEHALDWRNFVPGEMRRLWGRLNFETKVAIFIVATEAADWSGEHYPPANRIITRDKLANLRELIAIVENDRGRKQTAASQFIDALERSLPASGQSSTSTTT